MGKSNKDIVTIITDKPIRPQLEIEKTLKLNRLLLAKM